MAEVISRGNERVQLRLLVMSGALAATALMGCAQDTEVVAAPPQNEATETPMADVQEDTPEVTIECPEDPLDLVNEFYYQSPLATEAPQVKNYACDGENAAVHFGDDMITDNQYLFGPDAAGEEWKRVYAAGGADIAPCDDLSPEVASVLVECANS